MKNQFRRLLVLLILLVFVFVITNMCRKGINTRMFENIGSHLNTSDISVIYHVIIHPDKSQNHTNWMSWPTLEFCKNNSVSNSTVFFNTLKKSKKYSELNFDNLYPVMVDSNGFAKCSLLLNVSDKMDENIPLVISENINVQSLINVLSASLQNEAYELSSIKGVGVVMLKNNECFYVRTSYFGHPKVSIANWPNELHYLTPTGIVKVIVGSKHSPQGE